MGRQGWYEVFTCLQYSAVDWLVILWSLSMLAYLLCLPATLGIPTPPSSKGMLNGTLQGDNGVGSIPQVLSQMVEKKCKYWTTTNIDQWVFSNT